jgi:hypothetical protein
MLDSSVAASGWWQCRSCQRLLRSMLLKQDLLLVRLAGLAAPLPLYQADDAASLLASLTTLLLLAVAAAAVAAPHVSGIPCVKDSRAHVLQGEASSWCSCSAVSSRVHVAVCIRRCPPAAAAATTLKTSTLPNRPASSPAEVNLLLLLLLLLLRALAVTTALAEL